jgi:hypothetical protein
LILPFCEEEKNENDKNILCLQPKVKVQSNRVDMHDWDYVKLVTAVWVLVYDEIGVRTMNKICF